MCRDVKVLNYMKRSVFLLHAREYLCRMKQFKEKNVRRKVFVLADRDIRSGRSSTTSEKYTEKTQTGY